MMEPEKIAPQMTPAPAIVAPDEDVAQKTAASSSFTVLEASLPEQLGVARDLIRAIRQHQLTEGVDWVKRHKDILLTNAAVEKIGRALALISGTGPAPEATRSTGSDKPPALNGPGPGVNGEAREDARPPVKVEVFKVLRSVFRNSLMVSAFDPAEPKRIVWVRVKDNSKWAPGMTIHATHLQHDQYVLHGNNPRWRGKV